MRTALATSAALLLLGVTPFGTSDGVTQDEAGAVPDRLRYLGQPRPGHTPVVFAPGDVSTDARELGIVFTPGGREAYYTRVVDTLPMLFRRSFVDGTWTAEERLALVASEPDADHSDPAISPDGLRLYFSSNRAGGFGDQDIYRAQYRDGTFVDAVNLGPSLNTAQTEVDAYVSPDERTMILAARRDGNRGALDLYMTSRNADGSWQALTPLGDAVNTELTDYCPMLSPDGEYFFFSRRTAEGGDIYWMRASAIESLGSQP